MADLARLGFSIATDKLREAKAALESLVPSAKKAESAVDGLNASTSRTDSAVQQAASGTTSLGNRLSWFTGIIRTGTNSVLTFSRGLSTVPNAAGQAEAAVGRLNNRVAQTTGAMQANTGNIAAQFQDIGVTAAMGMNPLIIGLQQGTQLSAVFAQSGGTMAATLTAAFKQVASAQALTIIGLVALVAAAVQLVDWAKLAAGALNGLADIMVDIAPYAVALAAGLLLINAPAIIAGIVGLTKAMYGLAAGILAAIGLPTLLVAGLVAAVAAAVHFRDELTEIFGFDIVQAAQDGTNKIIGTFVGAYNGIKEVWTMLPAALGDVTIRAANVVIGALEKLITESINRMNPLLNVARSLGADVSFGGVSLGRLDNPYAGAEKATGQIIENAVRAGQRVDYVGKGIKLVRDYAKDAAGYMRKWASALTAGDPKKTGKTGAEREATGKTEAEKWADLLGGADKQMRGLQQAGAQIGVYGEALSRLKFEQELFNKAQDAGITLTDKMTAELKKRAAEMAAQETANFHNAFVEQTVQSMDAQSRALDMQRTQLGLTGQALDSYTYSQTILNDALNKHVVLTPAEIAAIRAAGDEYARSKAQIDQMTDAMKRQEEQLRFTRDTLKGLFTDWVQNVRNGQNVFGAFADSVLNALNKIIDKALDMALNSALNAVLPTGTKPFAKGGVFANDNEVTGFAKGGIVSSPTLFKFAKGTGLMGEAGPEAIMPLKRGADGSLGVQMHGNDNQRVGAPSVTIKNEYTIAGAVSSAEIQAQIRASAEQTKSDLARAVPSILQQYQRDGTIG